MGKAFARTESFRVRISRKRERVWRAGRGAEDRASGLAGTRIWPGRHQDFAPHAPGVSSRSRFPRHSSSSLVRNRHDVTSLRIGPLRCHIVAVGSARVWLLVWSRRRVRELRMPTGGRAARVRRRHWRLRPGQPGSGEDVGDRGQDGAGPVRAGPVRARPVRAGQGRCGQGRAHYGLSATSYRALRDRRHPPGARAGGLDYAGRRSRLNAMRDGLTAGIRSRTRASPHTVPVPTAAPATVSVK